jgi:Flp pilus assembly pilin Flp
MRSEIFFKAVEDLTEGYNQKPLIKKGSKKMKKLMAFLRDEDGLETVEYAIILGLVVAGTIGLVTSIGGWSNAQFARVQGELPGAPAVP